MDRREKEGTRPRIIRFRQRQREGGEKQAQDNPSCVVADSFRTGVAVVNCNRQVTSVLLYSSSVTPRPIEVFLIDANR